MNVRAAWKQVKSFGMVIPDLEIPFWLAFHLLFITALASKINSANCKHNSTVINL